jgi:dephospho-CoA kinase
MANPHVIGLTGGIASGKSTVAEMLRARGAAVVDADQLARVVVAPGQPALDDIAREFGREVLLADGTLDRQKLGAIVFSDPGRRAALERITHPRIAALAQAEIAAHAARGAQVVFYEAALLVERGSYRGFDALVVVTASPEVQRQRLAERDSLSVDDIERRLEAQLPLAEKVAVATWTVDNHGDRGQLEREVDALVRAVEQRFAPIAVVSPR